MATALKLRRGTTAQHASFTGALGEITVDTDKDTVVVHDGSTAGGFPLAKEGSTTAFAAGSASTPSITFTGDTNTGIFSPAADTIAFTEGGAESMRIDSSGNLGLGVTPSAWQSYLAFQMNAGSILSFSTNDYRMVQNTVRTAGAWKYVNNGYANAYLQDGSSGGHAWFTAASGTAGNTISFTQAMTLDASGNLGVGTTSPSAPIDVVQKSSDDTNALQLRGYTTGSDGTRTVNIRTVSSDANNWANMQLKAHSFRFVYQDSTERMRIDSSGNLLVGTTSALGKLGVSNSSTTTSGARFENGSSSITGKNVWSTYTSSGNNNTTAIHFAAYDGSVGGDVFRVYGNGNVVNNNNSYGSISDIKLKENIVDATPKLEKLCQVRVVNYNLIGQEQKQIGVVAQELESIFPSLIEESPDIDLEGNNLGTTTKQVKYSVFVPMLIKAMQEQQAIIETLTQRITALEQA